MQLFEQINVPHELDDWGRRVYDDSGNRLLYYQDEDGNTVIGYEAWYPCSVIGDCEDPRDCRTNGQGYDAAADYEVSCAPHEVCARRVITDMDDGATVVSDYETWYSCAETIEDEQDDPPNYLTFEPYGSESMLESEQQRFAEFLAGQNNKMPRFSSDRERIAAWIATAYVVADDDDDTESRDEEYLPVQDLSGNDVVSQWSEIY